MCGPPVIDTSMRRVCVGVVEHVERVVVLMDVELECLAGAVIDDDDARCVVAVLPEECDVKAVRGA